MKKEQAYVFYYHWNRKMKGNVIKYDAAKKR